MSTVSITVLWALNVQTLNDSKLSNTRARIGKKKRKGKKKNESSRVVDASESSGGPFSRNALAGVEEFGRRCRPRQPRRNPIRSPTALHPRRLVVATGHGAINETQ